MSGILKKTLNLGVKSSISFDLTERIRLTNMFAMMGFVATLTTLCYSFFTKLPSQMIYFILLIAVLALIPLLLNHYKKNYAARVFTLFFQCIGLLLISMLFDEKSHIQYFYIPTMYTPFMLLGSNENQKLKWLMFGLTLVFLVYLQWYHTVFEPLITIEASIINTVQLVNNIIVILICIIIYYFFTRENDDYVDSIIKQSKTLEEKNQHLEHFAYIAAHDLNEPLRTVNSFIDIIKEDHFNDKDEAQETYFTHIQTALSRMRAMIDGLLNYSRIGQSGQIELKDSNEFVQNIKIDLTKVIEEKKAIIKSKKLPILYCSTIEIRQLFQNLITNGIKFQSPGVIPVIEISCVDKKTHWEFCFADNGIGIEPKHLKNIFQIFKKLHLKTEFAGQGIGLAFCKKIVESHGGNIWVRSIQDKGSQFYFTIPKNVNLIIS